MACAARAPRVAHRCLDCRNRRCIWCIPGRVYYKSRGVTDVATGRSQSGLRARLSYRSRLDAIEHSCRNAHRVFLYGDSPARDCKHRFPQGQLQVLIFLFRLTEPHLVLNRSHLLVAVVPG